MAAGPVSTTPGAATPQSPVLSSARVTRTGPRMVARVAYRLPAGTTGTVPVAWRAFAGPRAARRMSPVGHGVTAVPVTGGTWTVTVRARMGDATDRAGGFCVVPDFTAVGLAPAQPHCAGVAHPTRRQLTGYVPEVTVFGDSVAATFDWVPGTREAVARGLSVRYDLIGCRRLVAAPCLPGRRSVLSAVRDLPGSLGDIVLIDVGYNDWGASYDVGAVLRALRARGVRRVVWVTLRQTQASYRDINGLIRAAARGGGSGLPGVQIADWDRTGAGTSWFAADRVHLTTAGGWGLAAFMRREILVAVRWLRDHRGRA